MNIYFYYFYHPIIHVTLLTELTINHIIFSCYFFLSWQIFLCPRKINIKILFSFTRYNHLLKKHGEIYIKIDDRRSKNKKKLKALDIIMKEKKNNTCNFYLFIYLFFLFDHFKGVVIHMLRLLSSSSEFKLLMDICTEYCTTWNYRWWWWWFNRIILIIFIWIKIYYLILK